MLNQPTNQPLAPIVQVQELDQNSKKRGRRFFKYTLIIFACIIIAFSSVLISRAVNLSNKIFVGKKTSFYSKVIQLIRGQAGSIKLVGEDLGQINVLLMGIGGQGHDGPYLSDTIIVAQIRPDLNKVTLISIPRDYLIDLQGQGYRKINAAFAEGFARHNDWNEAGTWAREEVEKISGLSIPYFAVVDFKGFEKAIDLVGGVDVAIDRTFTDYSYPDSKDGYLPPVTFSKGSEHMSGPRALIFARSRHASGPEGSDFSRSQRQQKIIHAVKSKVVSLNLITDGGKINELLSVIGDHMHTNIGLGEMVRFYNLVKNYDQNSVVSLSLDPSTNLICPQILETNGAYVLSLCPGKQAEDVKNFFKNSFNVGAFTAEKSIIWLADSSKDGHNYKKAEKLLAQEGLTVYQISYTGPALAQTVSYTVNNKPLTMDFLSKTLHATVVTLAPPGVKINKDRVDIVVILGSDADSLPKIESSDTTAKTITTTKTNNNTNTPAGNTNSEN